MTNEADGDPVNQKEAVDEMFEKVQSFCPLSCMNTDIKYLKTVIIVEKNRLRRLEAKEKQPAANMKSASSPSFTGGSNGVSVASAEVEKKLEAERVAKANAIKNAIAASALAHTNSPSLKVRK